VESVNLQHPEKFLEYCKKYHEEEPRDIAYVLSSETVHIRIHRHLTTSSTVNSHKAYVDGLCSRRLVGCVMLAIGFVLLSCVVTILLSKDLTSINEVLQIAVMFFLSESLVIIGFPLIGLEDLLWNVMESQTKERRPKGLMRYFLSLLGSATFAFALVSDAFRLFANPLNLSILCIDLEFRLHVYLFIFYFFVLLSLFLSGIGFCLFILFLEKGHEIKSYLESLSIVTAISTTLICLYIADAALLFIEEFVLKIAYRIIFTSQIGKMMSEEALLDAIMHAYIISPSVFDFQRFNNGRTLLTLSLVALGLLYWGLRVAFAYGKSSGNLPEKIIKPLRRELKDDLKSFFLGFIVALASNFLVAASFENSILLELLLAWATVALNRLRWFQNI